MAQGFCIGAVSPAVLVPSVMNLIEKKYGVAKGIPQIMLAASSFDDIAAITFFSVFSTIAIENAGADDFAKLEAARLAAAGTSGASETAVAKVAADAASAGGTDVKTMIGMAVFYVVVGFFVGFFIGMCMKCFKTCEDYEFPDAAIKWLKFAAMLSG